MDTHSPDQLAHVLCETTSNAGVLLFAGAGVGMRVGLPSWSGYIGSLADVCESYGDAPSAQLIRQRASDQDLLGAATVFTSSRRVPAGERLRHLASPFQGDFSEEQLELLDPLLSINFSGIVTTNYDRSLHAAAARTLGLAPVPVELDDETLRNAALRADFFIARIHGRAEKPQSLVVDSRDYELLDGNDCYLDFLLSLLTQRSCVFVGFSFTDPAISQILQLYKSRVGPNFPSLHVALLPLSAAPTLGLELNDVNIRTFYYDDEERHKNLWRAFRIAKQICQRSQLRTRISPVSKVVRAGLHRFFAFGYTQLATRKYSQPLLDIAQDGLVRSVLSQKSSGVGQDELTKEIRNTLHLSDEEAAQIASASLSRLESAGEISVSSNLITFASDVSANVFDEHIDILVNAVTSRMKVREGVATKDHDVRVVKAVLEGLFVARAWDLAAHFAGAASGYASDLPEVINRLISEESKRRSTSGPGAMQKSILHLISYPDIEESRYLAELGRAAFAVQLVLSSPRQALFQKYSLPQRVYLDASIVLPLIVSGHPLRPIYSDVITRLTDAAKRVGNYFSVVVGYQFLNEVVSHKRIAFSMVTDLRLEDRDQLRRHVTLYGAPNTNVYVAAYSAHVSNAAKPIPFAKFIREYAPYDSEEELAVYLQQFGINIERMSFHDQYNAEFATTFSRLREGYEELGHGYSRKETLLVEHDAQQLTRLELDAKQGIRSIFASSDMGLQRVVQRDGRLHHLVGAILSQLGLVGLVDVMVGLEPDNRSLARLMWGMARTGPEQSVRDYLIHQALREYDAALAMSMHRLVDTMAENAALELERAGLDSLRANSVDDVARTALFFDELEKRFFVYMREEMEKNTHK
jgi:hypothetical protein